MVTFNCFIQTEKYADKCDSLFNSLRRFKAWCVHTISCEEIVLKNYLLQVLAIWNNKCRISVANSSNTFPEKCFVYYKLMHNDSNE